MLCTFSLSSTFKGSSNKVRTRFLDLKLLEDDDFENMMAMCDTLEDWLKQAFKKFQQKKLKFAHQMFTEIDEPRLVSSSSLSQGCIFFKLVHFLPQLGPTRVNFSPHFHFFCMLILTLFVTLNWNKQTKPKNA